MKTPTLAASAALTVVMAATPALARQARPPASGAVAATLPNAFADEPAKAPAALAPRPVAPTLPRAAAAPRAPDVARSEEALRAVIGQIQAGSIDYSAFSDDLARQVRAQAEQMTPLVRQFGALRSIAHLGQPNGADLFRATFENQATEWIIGFDEENQIAALLFRPAEQP